MSEPRIEIGIILEKPEATFTGGEAVAGEVTLKVLDGMPDAAVEVVLLARGSAETREGGRFTYAIEQEIGRQALFQGPLEPGHAAHPFRLAAPPGPSTYQGAMIGVRWALRAEVRPARAEAMTGELPLVLLPATGGAAPAGEEVVHRETAPRMAGCFLFSLLLLLGGAAGAWKWAGRDAFPFAVVAALGGLACLALCVYQAMVNRRIASAETRLGARSAPPGGRIPVRVEFHAARSFRVARVVAILRGVEEAGNLSVHTSKTRTVRKVVHEKAFDLACSGVDAPAGVPVWARGEVEVPAGGPCTLALLDGLQRGVRVTWKVEFRIEMERWPDWSHTEDLEVRP
jgi:hypothetical protein